MSRQQAIVNESAVQQALNFLEDHCSFFGALFLDPSFQDWCTNDSQGRFNNMIRIDHFMRSMLELNEEQLSFDRVASLLQFVQLGDEEDVKYLESDDVIDPYFPCALSEDVNPLVESFANALVIGEQNDGNLNGLLYDDTQAMESLLQTCPQLVVDLLKLSHSVIFKEVFKDWNDSLDYQTHFMQHFGGATSDIDLGYFTTFVDRLKQQALIVKGKEEVDSCTVSMMNQFCDARGFLEGAEEASKNNLGNYFSGVSPTSNNPGDVSPDTSVSSPSCAACSSGSSLTNQQAQHPTLSSSASTTFGREKDNNSSSVNSKHNENDSDEDDVICLERDNSCASQLPDKVLQKLKM